MSRPTKRSTPCLTLAALLAAPLLLVTPGALAQPAAGQTPATQKAGAAKLPITPADHLALAEGYAKKAVRYRAEAALHKAMLEAYKEGFTRTEGQFDEDPYVKKERTHCEAYIKPAEALAVEAEKFAEFHRMRAAGAQPAAPAPLTQKPEAVKLPVTPADHLALAEEYKKKAAGYRAEAAVHKTMLEDYKQALSGQERVSEDPYVTKMRIHCEAVIKPAEALAVEAEKFADFHRIWAAALQGK